LRPIALTPIDPEDLKTETVTGPLPGRGTRQSWASSLGHTTRRAASLLMSDGVRSAGSWGRGLPGASSRQMCRLGAPNPKPTPHKGEKQREVVRTVDS